MTFQGLTIKKEYRSLLNNVVNEFYIPVLNQAVIYKRAVGFFSSSALVELSRGICGLVKNNGKIELIVSPKLSEEDIVAIEDGFQRRKNVIEECLLRSLTDPCSRFEEERLNLLSNLIAMQRLDIKIAFLENDNHVGMFHEKMGLMYDSDKNIIAFSGSMNESETAFSYNYESIDVFTSWSGDKERAFTKQDAFNSLWNDCEPCIKILDFPSVSKAILNHYKRNDQIDISIDEREYIGYYEIHKSSGFCREQIDDIDGPFIPGDVVIRSYQNGAINSWEKQNYHGIFDMATGTGKTYTALAAISHLYQKEKNNLGVVIVCPFQHLVEQWRVDAEKFGMKPIICYSSSTQRDWRERIKIAVTSFNLGVKKHFCIITTNATFASDYVQNYLKRLRGSVVLVVDEAHNFGAANLSGKLLQHIPFRLALSATIDRYGDEEGTQKLYDYFGEKCIQYTLKEAIDSQMLTPYYYYPVLVSLTDVELNRYLEITRKIAGNVQKNRQGQTQLNEYAKMLLIKRARLVAAANEKIFKLRALMETSKDDNHMLVYCGATTVHDLDYKENIATEEEQKQIDVVADILGNELEMRVSKFTSEESAEEREVLKKEFSEGKHLQALIAIRCLDEGVNIPSITKAFILASSTNPKEYIQRRGRVLRNFPGKKHAIIYDFVTLPISLGQVNQYPEEVIHSVKSLVTKEMSRMKDFAAISENPSAVDDVMMQIIDEYSIGADERDDDFDA